jgi:hypothetical protein
MANSFDCNTDAEWSTQATKGSDNEEEKPVVSLKQPPCRGHPNFEKFGEYLKLDEERRVFLRKYVAENPTHFCVKCGLNTMFTNYLFATYEYEALVLPRPNCHVCGSKEGRICDAYQHKEYHKEHCVKT